jgi:hypothetical protein
VGGLRQGHALRKLRRFMDLFDRLAEERITAAIAAGEFDDLPGAGQPLRLDDDALVPAELRMAWRILKNAGFVPPEVEALRDIRELTRALGQAEEEADKRRLALRLSLLQARLARQGIELRLLPEYGEKLAARFGGRG